ncbi:ACP S-malonyltransferase [Paenibacillus sp. SAFN-117]|uniref:ACP S-malonyltransferase n=1 Tax=Paenibacillus sp. SAFN-117 TaxID=3436860 RepID=UPI003F806DAE
MGKLAFVFPGQGAQSVGMGQDVYESNPDSRKIFDEADEVLGFDQKKLIFEGPEAELKKTYHTQPALLTTSIAYYEALRQAAPAPDYVAGHSLGEYSALVVAGVLSFADAVRIVRLRGEYMESAVPGGQGAMAAVLGADRAALESLCARLSREAGIVEPANVNCPGQIVVSGSKEGVQAVIEHGKEAGAKRVLPLEVSGPFHSSLMKPAAERLADTLRNVPMNPAGIPVIANVSAQPVTDPEEIRRLLVEQVCAPVLWEDSIRRLIDEGVDTFVELGSGTVLAGLIKKIDRSVRVLSVNSKEAVDQALAEL